MVVINQENYFSLRLYVSAYLHWKNLVCVDKLLKRKLFPQLFSISSPKSIAADTKVFFDFLFSRLVSLTFRTESYCQTSCSLVITLHILDSPAWPQRTCGRFCVQFSGCLGQTRDCSTLPQW